MFTFNYKITVHMFLLVVIDHQFAPLGNFVSNVCQKICALTKEPVRLTQNLLLIRFFTLRPNE